MSLSAYESDPRLLLFTSLTAGSSHIITATSRLETILKANKIPFLAIDLATDEGARRLWQRRGQGRKLPGLVREGFVVGGMEEVEEWNEFGELREVIGAVPAVDGKADGGSGIRGVSIRPAEATSPSGKSGVPGPGVVGPPLAKSPVEEVREEKSLAGVVGSGVALPGAAEIKERSAAAAAAKAEAGAATATATASATKAKAETEESEGKKDTQGDRAVGGEAPKNAAKALLKEDHPGLEHLSAPPSALPSGSVTPAVVEEERAAWREEAEGKGEGEKGHVVPAKHETSIQWASETKEAPGEEAEGAVEGEGQRTTKVEEEEQEETVSEDRGAPPVSDEKAAETKDDDAGVEEVTEDVEAAQIEDKAGEKTQEQGAKEAENASKSVQD